jgi:hypothetical protein
MATQTKQRRLSKKLTYQNFTQPNSWAKTPRKKRFLRFF